MNNNHGKHRIHCFRFNDLKPQSSLIQHHTNNKNMLRNKTENQGGSYGSIN